MREAAKHPPRGLRHPVQAGGGACSYR